MGQEYCGERIKRIVNKCVYLQHDKSPLVFKVILIHIRI